MSCTLRFPSYTDELSSHTSYKLLELPPSLLSEIESSSSSLTLSLKGDKSDDAVLCTSNTTYAVRSVVLSNTLIIATSPGRYSPRKASRVPGTQVHLDQKHSEMPLEGDIVIRSQLHEILELVPIVPKLERIDSILRGDEPFLGQELLGDNEPQASHDLLLKRKRYTYNQVRGMVQASDAELDEGLKIARVVTIDGTLRHLSLAALSGLLQKMLVLIVSSSYRPSAIPLDRLCQELYDEHAILPELTEQLVHRFGTISEEGNKRSWNADIVAIVRQIGLELLSYHKDIPIDESAFMENWRTVVGDTFEGEASLAQLKGNFLSSDSLPDPPPSISTKLHYFPSSALPFTPAARFSDLFLTRGTWRSDVLEPYLEDIAKDGKERDKLLLKFCRVVVDKDGRKWCSARAKY